MNDEKEILNYVDFGGTNYYSLVPLENIAFIDVDKINKKLEIFFKSGETIKKIVEINDENDSDIVLIIENYKKWLNERK